MPSKAAVTAPVDELNPLKSAASVECSAVTAMLPLPAAAIVSPVTSAAVAVTVISLATEAVLESRLPIKVCVSLKLAVRFVISLVILDRSAAASALAMVTTSACALSEPS